MINQVNRAVKRDEATGLQSMEGLIATSAAELTTQVRPTFLSIRQSLKERFKRFTPVTPDGKCGAQVHWPTFQLITDELAEKYAGPGTKFEFHNVGIVSPGEGIGNLCFLDPDAKGVIRRIEEETRQKLPTGYKVCTRPLTDPERVHHYYTQTAYSVRRFSQFFVARSRKRGEKKGKHWTKNINVKSLTDLNDDGGYLNLYDFKGIGGASLVVSEGSLRPDGQRYECTDPSPVPPIPDWLVDWVIEDFRKFEAGKEEIREAKLKAKRDAWGKYTPKQRATLRKKNIPDGFDVDFEDKYEFLLSRSLTYAKMGLSPTLIESALAEQARDFIHGGAQWLKTEKGRETIHKIATNTSLKRGNASRFYETKELKKWTDKSNGLVIRQTVQFPRHEAMLQIVNSFPMKIHKDDAYGRLETELRGMGHEFDRSVNKDHVATANVRKKLGFEVKGGLWIRASEMAEATT